MMWVIVRVRMAIKRQAPGGSRFHLARVDFAGGPCKTYILFSGSGETVVFKKGWIFRLYTHPSLVFILILAYNLYLYSLLYLILCVYLTRGQIDFTCEKEDARDI